MRKAGKVIVAATFVVFLSLVAQGDVLVASTGKMAPATAATASSSDAASNEPSPTSKPTSQPTSKPAAAEAKYPTHPGEWETSAAEAIRQAKESNLPILADFTGSDWCLWCKKLKGEVFDTKEFKDWAGKNVILLEVDYPWLKRQDAGLKKQNAELASTYRITGYPTVLFLKADGTVIGKSGYSFGGPRPWLTKAAQIVGKAAK